MCAPWVVTRALAAAKLPPAALALTGLGLGVVAGPALGARLRPSRATPAPVDLTHPLSPRFPVFPGDDPATSHVTQSYAADGYQVRSWHLSEHAGTHLDAPAHFAPDGQTVETCPLADLLGIPAIVVDLTARAQADPDALLTVADLAAWEAAHGLVPPGAAVLLSTGWDRRVDDAAAFLGLDQTGGLHFPGFAPAAAEWLVTARRVAGLGTDAPSIDHGPATDYGAHRAVLGAGRYALECLRGLDRLPPRGRDLWIAPLPLVGGTGSPARVIAV